MLQLWTNAYSSHFWIVLCKKQNKTKSHKDTQHVIAEVQNCHWEWSTHHTEATGEKNQREKRGGNPMHICKWRPLVLTEHRNAMGKGLLPDLPAKKSHWISSQPWLKAFPQSVKPFCSKQSHIILCSGASREGLTESVLSTITLLKIWIKEHQETQTAGSWKRSKKESEITIIVSLSQADGEPIHSKYRVHKKPLFLLLVLSGSDIRSPSLCLTWHTDSLLKISTNDFNKRKHTMKICFHCPCYIWKWDFRSAVNKST